MGVAAPRRPSSQAVSPRQVSDTLSASISRQTQSFKTSYTFSVTETAVSTKATPLLPTERLLAFETPVNLSSFVSPATSSSSHSSAVALGIVFGVFFGTIIFSFILWRLCRRPSTPKSSTSTWPSSAKATTIMPVRYSSTMRYPQRPTSVRVKSSDRNERTLPSSVAEKTHAAVKVVKVIQSDVPPPSSQRDSHPVTRKGHRRDNSTPRLHPGRQAVVDVSSPTTDTWVDKDIHRGEWSRHNNHLGDRPSTRDGSHQDPHHSPPVIYIAGRASHERSSRRSREREQHDQHDHRQTAQSRSRVRRSQPSIVNVVHESSPAVHAASISAPAIPTSTRSYQQPRYDSPSTTTITSELSDNIGEEPPSLTTSSSSSSSSSSEGRRSWTRTRPRSTSPQSLGRVRFTLPEGVRRYLDTD